MHERVEYATTADGVSIAYTATGDGLSVLFMPPIPFRHVQPKWMPAPDTAFLRHLGRGRRLIQYDPRGLGLSDRGALPESPHDLERDLEAVVHAAGCAPVALLAVSNTAPLAITFAARHPERVSHLVLWCGSPYGTDGVPPQLEALLAVAERDWEVFTEAAAQMIHGWSGGPTANRFAAYLRECVTAPAAHAHLRVGRALDASAFLATLETPTLVVHRREATSVPLERARALAATIPGAQLVIQDGHLLMPSVGDVEAGLAVIDEFLADRRPPVPVPEVVGAESVFRCDGEVWTVAFAGTVARLRDAKGLHHIARLLRQPECPIAAIELLAGDEVRGAGDAGPVLDGQARDAYRRRLRELRGDLDDAEQNNDPGAGERARREIEAIEDELRAAIGLGHRARVAGSDTERARLTVTKRIKDALARVSTRHPVLGEHLDASLRTGTFCVYSPDPELHVTWSR